MCHPHTLSRQNERYAEYERMITYFIEQDLVPLEKKNWGGFKVGDLCKKCNNGHLQNNGRESTGATETDFSKCDACGLEFKNYRLHGSDTIVFS